MKKLGVGCVSVTELEKKYVLEALENQRLSQGKFVYNFEKNFSKLHETNYGVMCNSGTSALILALEALKEIYNWDENCEVLCPAITFIATSNAIIHAGLKVVFVDVDSKTYNINPTEIEKHITKNTKCIIPVHTFGLPCDMVKIMEIAKKYNLKVIEDCAEAHFAKINNKPVGSFGDISSFSTYVAHTITTGIGGIVCTKDKKISEILRSLLAHGRACTCEICIASENKRNCPLRMNSDIDKRFLFERIGYSFRVGEIEGALGVAQLERKDEIISKRRKNAIELINGLEKFEDFLQLPKYDNNYEHTYMMFPIFIKNHSIIDRKKLISFLEKNNIETRPMLPLLNQPIYKKFFGELEDLYPTAKKINSNGFYIGCHHEMNSEDIKYIIKIFKDFFEQEKLVKE